MARSADSVQIGTSTLAHRGGLDAQRFIVACLIVLFHFKDAAVRWGAAKSRALRCAVAMRLPKPRGLDLDDRPAPKGYVELVLDKGPLRLA